MNSNSIVVFRVRVQKILFFEFKFELGKNHRVQVRVCSPACGINRVLAADDRLRGSHGLVSDIATFLPRQLIEEARHCGPWCVS